MRAREIEVALDCLLNACCGGYAGETVSARTWRLRGTQPFKTILPVLDWTARVIFRDPDHCRSSYEAILNRAHLPPEYQPASAGFFTPTEKGSNETE